jgi:hypothetical protein
MLTLEAPGGDEKMKVRWQEALPRWELDKGEDSSAAPIVYSTGGDTQISRHLLLGEELFACPGHLTTLNCIISKSNTIVKCFFQIFLKSLVLSSLKGIKL